MRGRKKDWWNVLAQYRWIIFIIGNVGVGNCLYASQNLSNNWLIWTIESSFDVTVNALSCVSLRHCAQLLAYSLSFDGLDDLKLIFVSRNFPILLTMMIGFLHSFCCISSSMKSTLWLLVYTSVPIFTFASYCGQSTIPFSFQVVFFSFTNCSYILAPKGICKNYLFECHIIKYFITAIRTYEIPLQKSLESFILFKWLQLLGLIIEILPIFKFSVVKISLLSNTQDWSSKVRGYKEIASLVILFEEHLCNSSLFYSLIIWCSYKRLTKNILRSWSLQ